MSAKSELPLCKYGKDCYRKNPAHFMEYSHPHLKGTQDKPKGDKPEGDKRGEIKIVPEIVNLETTDDETDTDGNDTDGSLEDFIEYEEEERMNPAPKRQKLEGKKNGPG
jgi:hypothetical protein